mmetsp:Transcript_10956/g.21441  ORF Transcript_10956/g.21441 Transcript_10956/m.21441 type:complete len:848 (-) Transcript_10956:693-3236(-)
MGNNTSLITEWDTIIQRQALECLRCRDSYLINEETDNEYILRHRVQKDCYVAVSGDDSCLVSIIRCPNFPYLKYIHLTARMLTRARHVLVEKVQDSFSFKERGSRFLKLVVVMPNRLGVSLEEWVLHSQTPIQLENILKAFFDCLELIRNMHSTGRRLGFISTKNLILHKDSNTLGFSFKLLGGFPSYYELPPEEDYFSHEADIWGVGCLLFTQLTGILPAESRLGHKPETERQSYIRKCVNDVALSEVIMMCCCAKDFRKECEEILSHPYIKYWMGGSVLLTPDLLQAVSTQLKFSTKQAKTTAVKAIFSLSNYDTPRVFSFIQLHGIDWNLLTSIFCEAMLSSVQLEGALTLFNSAIKHTKGARRLMHKQGMSEVILRKSSLLGFSRIIEFFGELCSKSSCTVPVILYDKKLHLKALKHYHTCMHSQNFLYNTAPFFGIYAVSVILLAYQRKIWNYNQAIEILLKVPFHNLILHKQSVLEIVETCVDSLVFSQYNFNSCLQNALKLLSTITCVREVFEHTSQRGSCLSSPEFSFTSDLVRNPLVIFCADCAVPVCTFCGATCHAKCRLRPMYPQSAYKSCRCNEQHEEDKQKYPIFNIKKRGLYIFKAVNQANIETVDLETYRISCCRFTGDPVVVTSLETLVPNDKWDKTSNTAFYYEAKVVSAGLRDALSIGVEGLEYQSWNGQIVDGESKLVMRAVPFGSHDSVGVGITHDNKAYFTLNGLMMHPLLSLPSCHLKIKFLSEEASVLLLFNSSRCLFQPKVASQLSEIRFRAAQSIPRSLQDKLERLLFENYTYFEEENRLDDLLMFLSSQFSGQVGRSVLHRAIRSADLRRGKCEQGQCTLQ